MTDHESIRRAVLDYLSARGEWLSLSDILAAQGSDLAPRTLRRWLKAWVEQGVLVSRGGQRNRQYRAISAGAEEGGVGRTAAVSQAPPGPLSERARAALRRLDVPIFQRPASTYRDEWVEAYVPNQSFYLSESQRETLASSGSRFAGAMPAGTFARRIYNRLLVDLSYNSSRLEGNTYSLAETERLLLEGVAADDKLDAEQAMILNHRDAIQFLVEGINRLEISVSNIQSLHYLLADGLVAPGMAGELRDEGVRIGGSRYLPLERRHQLLPRLERLVEKAQAIRDPYEQSFFLLVHLAYLQPFVDVNKRTARLAANLPLVRHNLVPLSFHDVDPGDYHAAILVAYEFNDVSPLAELYVWTYLRSCRDYDVAADAVGFDPLRVKYRKLRRQVIAEIVAELLTGPEMEARIQARSLVIPEQDREHFLHHLHEDLGALAPHRIAGMGLSRQQLEAWLARSRDHQP
ncbi:fido (protein-threonine AMPylation protein) [Halomonas campaniensis]|uniref:Fido (Protein-threonine AMPylation protein) n=1 Tax=Halomonas campaniensis TaxID=213554 RepID=A0A7W5PD02_9GAMM|nr:Fic family protein [Halomonas campaniensis]MBB3332526.1 fido (protein-threonine AMPylation protein) [Halomonas campaniensis]